MSTYRPRLTAAPSVLPMLPVVLLRASDQLAEDEDGEEPDSTG